jgi:hypothetical protein
MTVLPFLELATSVATSGTGLAVVRLLGSRGLALTLATVARCLVASITKGSKGQERIIGQYKSSHEESQMKFQEQLDRLFDCRDESQHRFQVCVTLMSETQNTVLQDVIDTLKSFEDLNTDSSLSIENVQTSVSALYTTIQTIDAIVGNSVESESATELLPRQTES